MKKRVWFIGVLLISNSLLISCSSIGLQGNSDLENREYLKDTQTKQDIANMSPYDRDRHLLDNGYKIDQINRINQYKSNKRQ